MSLFVYTIGFLLLILSPILLVLFNKRFSAKAKVVGVFASFFFSWLGFIVFFVLNSLDKRAAG